MEGVDERTKMSATTKHIRVLQTTKHCKVNMVEDRHGECYIMKTIKRPSTLLEAEVPYKLKRYTKAVAVPFRVDLNADSCVLYIKYYEFKDLTFMVKSLHGRSKIKAILSVADAVHKMHKNLKCMHNDIKPDNILVDTNFSVKLTDFGLCNYKLYDCTSFVGTPRYMSPEKFAKRYDYRADIWALGVTAFYIITNGHLPYSVMDEHEDVTNQEWIMNMEPLNCVHDTELRDLLLRMLDVRIEHRLTDLAEIIERFKLIYNRTVV